MRAYIFINVWIIGRYINNVDRNTSPTCRRGILNYNGSNTIAIAVWALDSTGASLSSVSLFAEAHQAGGIPVALVESPGYGYSSNTRSAKSALR